jgi:hypothetical protein
MRNRVLAAFLATLVAMPAGALAQGPDGAHGMHARTEANAGGRWFVPPRPRGWYWGRPGWWGGSYSPPVRGYIVPSFWLSPDYVVPDWEVYGFSQPGRGQRWVRYYDDALLVDGRGMIHDSVQDVSWGSYARGPVPQYVGDEPDSPPAYGMGYDYGTDDQVTWDGGSRHSGHQIWAWPGQAQNMQSGTVIMVPPNSVTTITFQPQRAEPVAYVEAPRSAPYGKVQRRGTSKAKVVRRVPVKKD